MNIFKKTAAILSAILITFSFTACNDKKDNVTTTAENTTFATTVEETVITTEAEITAEETTTQPETTSTTAAPTTTEKPTTTTTKPTTTKKPTTTAKPTTTKKVTTTQKLTAPTSKADIVKLYNTAAATVSSSKAGYKKSTNTSITNLEMGALASISAVRETIGNFLGEGSTTETIKKGKFDGKEFVKSSLSASDVSSATCTLSSDGKYYNVKITVKNETNPKKSSSAIGRFTKDYKDVDEIKAGLADAGASVESMTVKTSSVIINAKIRTDNNRFESVTHNIKMGATLNGIKYSIVKVKQATANLETKVSYSNFKY